MKNWDVSTRFVLSIAIFSFPLIVMIYYIHLAATDNIIFAQKENEGVQYLLDVNEFEATLINDHLQATLLGKQKSSQDTEILSKRWSSFVDYALSNPAEKESAFKAFADYFAKREKALGFSDFPFAALDKVRSEIGNKSNLILDPDLDSYYIMDATLLAIPGSQRQMDKVFDLVLSTPDNISIEKNAHVTYSAGTMDDAFNRILADLETAKKSDEASYGLNDQFQKSYSNYENQYKTMRDLVGEILRTPKETLGEKRSQNLTALVDVYAQGFKQNKDLLIELRNFIDNRLHSLEGARAQKIYGALAALFIALVISSYFGLTISKTFVAFKESVMQLKHDAQVSLDIGTNLIETSQQVSNSSQQQAAAIEETSASLEEVTSMIKINATNSKQARDLADVANESSRTGEADIVTLVESMGEISRSAKRIEEIMTIIDDISFQTNLLALNASVEAARAGEHGKGFAVVAEAVRSLAGRSAISAKEIKVLIQDSLEKISKGTMAANKSGQVIKDIRKAVEKVNMLNGEIASASQEQATGIEQIGRALGDLEKATQKNTAVASQAADYSSQAMDTANDLMEIVQKLDKELGGRRLAKKDSSDFAVGPALSLQRTDLGK